MWLMHKIRVRYQETDQMGVVYHANYLNWFELGRTEWIRAQGISYRSLEEEGLLLPVIQLDTKFISPARYDEMIRIYTRLKSFGGLRVSFEVQICRCPEDGHAGDPVMTPQAPVGELLVQGTTHHAWLNRSWKPVRIDRAYPKLYAMMKAGVK